MLIIPCWTRSRSGRIYAGISHFYNHLLQKHNVSYYDKSINYLLSYHIVECFWSWWYFYIGRKVKIFHIMRAISILLNMSPSSWTESFNCIILPLLHFSWSICLAAGNCFACMNFIWLNWMTIKIFYHLYWVYFSFYLYLIWFHSFLNSSSYICESHIDSCLLYPRISGIFNCL